MIAAASADDRIIALMQAYHVAEYRWELAGQWHRLAIGARATELEVAFPEARSFSLLSAWNPHSVERPDAENRAADDALHVLLDASALPYRAGFSSSANRSWREPSWVVMDLPEVALDALAARFGQLGTLRAERGGAVRLRMHHARPHNCPVLAHVDWVK